MSRNPSPNFQAPPPAAPPTRPGCTGRALLTVVAVVAGITLVLFGLTLAGYIYLAAELPPPDELRARTATFRSTRILDRNGQPINETFDPNAGRRTLVPLAEISPYLLQATIATEDVHFYSHPGVDPIAILRAAWYAIQEREVVSGASTIPQQLVKQAFLSSERSVSRKIKEAVLANEITRRYSKDEILELYLNEIFYGNLAYGARSAAESYFGKAPKDLTLAEAALLAGLPQAPAYYDPYTNPERARARQAVVLDLMVEAGYITGEQAEAAKAEEPRYKPVRFDLNAPHFTLLVREQVEQLYGPDALYKLGLTVTTTLDIDLQQKAQDIVKEQVAGLAGRHVTNGALVSMHPDTGEIVAFVGSADFEDAAISGQVNMATSPRQPGSSTKPFVYLANFMDRGRSSEAQSPEACWNPGTLIADITTEFPDGANPPYVPVNYDGQEHGIVTARTALANSYNIPAVKALQTAGLPAFLDLMRRLGISTLNRPDYGLGVALGAGEMPLVELTGAFGALASGGYRHPPVAILKISDSAGNVVCDQADPAHPCRPGPVDDGGVARQRVVDPADAFLVTSILSDNEARVPAFGTGSALELDRPAAVKTGTTNDYRDNLTVGYTPQFVTGVWVGNADNSPMRGVSGVTGAGPIWNAFMREAHKGVPITDFSPPPGVRQVEVCEDSGTLPSDACPRRRLMWFGDTCLPLPADKDLWQAIRIDRATGQRAGPDTPDDRVDVVIFKIYPPEHRAWAIAHGIPQPPEEIATREPGDEEETEEATEDVATPTSGITPTTAVPTAATSPATVTTIAPASSTPAATSAATAKPSPPPATLAPRPTVEEPTAVPAPTEPPEPTAEPPTTEPQPTPDPGEPTAEATVGAPARVGARPSSGTRR